MPLNQLDIVNSALVGCGAAPIQQLGQGAQGIAAAAFWNLALAATLRAHPWNFAIKRKALAASADAPVFGYTNAFPLPPDWIRTLSTDVDDYQQESGTILCNSASLNLRYVGMVTDPARFDTLFADALAAHLSAKLAYPLTKSASQASVCWDQYTQLLRLARSVDSLETPAEEFEESSLIRVRG